MPSYAYRCTDPDCDHVFGVVKPVSQCKTQEDCEECGGKTERDYRAEHSGTFHASGTWPMASEAAGCHVDQVPEAVEQAAKLGVPTEFTKDGRPIFTSAGHRKKFCEAHHLYDRNGGYSDPQRR